MTWVVGGNCFNGFVCVADIQATVQFQNKQPDIYFNCIQKIHKVFDNLCVAFSGDIRTGLLIIKDLSVQMKNTIRENEYFDIDGQSSLLIDYLKRIYKKINPKLCPHLELMFLWIAQEGEEIHYRPFLMKFNAPEFRINSTPLLGISQSGSGIRNESYNSIVSFLSGRPNDSEVYKIFFGNNGFAQDKSSLKIWTVQKFKNILFNEASTVDYLGVSKSLISFESVIPYKDMYPVWLHSILKDTFIDIGIEYSTENTANQTINLATMDFEKIDYRIRELEKNDHSRLDTVREVLSFANEIKNFDSICNLPQIKSDYFLNEEEQIHSEKLITNWDDMISFLQKNNINIKACSAIA